MIGNMTIDEVYAVEVTGDILGHILRELADGGSVPCSPTCTICEAFRHGLATARFERLEPV